MYFLSKLRKKARDYTYVQRWMLPSEGSCSMNKSDRFACQCNCKSHKSEKRCIACSREEGHGAISKVMPSLSQESVRILFGAPTCAHISRHLCGRIIPEHVSVKSEFKKMANTLWAFLLKAMKHLKS